MRCLDDVQVLDYLGHRVPAETASAIQQHLDTCTTCLNLVAAMTATTPPPSVGNGTGLRRPLPAVDPEHYEIGDTIATGGMGRILAATDRRLDRPIAIKELLVDSEQLRARFEREARITAKLQHPSIVNIIEAGVWPGGEPFFAMKRVVGTSLAKRLRTTASLDERLGLLSNVTALADALAYAHDQRIIHRDLKPDNVLLGDYGETVVIDWGLAKDLGAPADDVAAADVAKGTPVAEATGTVAGTVLGTPAYMPPEQALGEPVDERADVYALGAILYELLSGRAAYRGPSVDAVLAAVVEGPPPRLRDIVPGVPRDLATIVEKAMAREPADRYRTAKPLAEDLRRFQTGQLVASHHYSVGQRFARWVRRYRAAVFVGSTALAVLAVVGVISVRGIVDARARAEDQRKAAEVARAQAETSRGDAEELMDFMLGNLRQKLEPIGKLDVLAAVATKARDYYAKRPPPETSEDMRRQIDARVVLGSVLATQGDSKGAGDVFRAAVDMAEKLVKREPTNIKWQQELVKSQLKLAALLATQGDSAGARAGHEAAITGAEKILAVAPTDTAAMFGAQDGHLRLADILRAQGDMKGAVEHGQKALAYARKLVAGAPTDARWQRTLSLCLRVLVEIYKAQHDLKSATPLVREAADVSEALLAKDPTNPAAQMDVVRTREKLVELYEEQGDLDAALAEVELLRKTAVDRVEQDPSDATRRDDAAMAIRRVGLIHKSRKEYPAAIADLRKARDMLQELTAQDPANKLWQNGLSYVHGDLGETLEATKHLADALPEYIASRDIRKELAARDPHDMSIKNDLALAHELVANTLRDLHKLDAAIAEFKASVDLAREMSTAKPDDVHRRVALMALLAHLGETQAQAKKRGDARASYTESLEVLNKLRENHPTEYTEELATLQQALAELK